MYLIVPQYLRYCSNSNCTCSLLLSSSIFEFSARSSWSLPHSICFYIYNTHAHTLTHDTAINLLQIYKSKLVEKCWLHFAKASRQTLSPITLPNTGISNDNTFASFVWWLLLQVVYSTVHDDFSRKGLTFWLEKPVKR